MSEISNVKFHSNALKKLMAFSIYLPDTGNCSEKLPALYFNDSVKITEVVET